MDIFQDRGILENGYSSSGTGARRSEGNDIAPWKATNQIQR
jgi:hypothetical protein